MQATLRGAKRWVVWGLGSARRMETEGLLGGMRQRRQPRRGGFAAIRPAEPISHQWIEVLEVIPPPPVASRLERLQQLFSWQDQSIGITAMIWSSYSSSGTPRLVTAKLRTLMPLRWTRSGSPESSGCQRASLRPSATRR